jgi:CHAT domain-containing protein/tetratricopeptide (TPR) repeat protein
MVATGRTRVAAIVLAVAGLLVVRPAAQDQTAGPPLAELLATAQKAYSQNRLDEATAGFRTLLDAATEQHADLWVARAKLGLGSVDYLQGHYASARMRLLDALATFEALSAAFETGYASTMLGNVAWATGDLPEARTRYTRAIAAFEAVNNLQGKVNAAIDLLRVTDDDPVQSQDRFADAIRDARTVGSHQLEASALHLWGDRLFTHGDYELAIEKLNEAAGVLADGSAPGELGTIYNSLGRLYRVHGQTAVALQYQLKALAIHEKAGTSYERVQSLNAVAATYQALGDFGHATQYFEQAIALAEQVASPSVLAFLRASYGDLLSINGEPARGRAMLAQSLPDASPAQQALRYAQLAAADRALGRLQDALTEARQGMDHCAAASPIDCANAQLERASIELALGDEAAALADQQAVLQKVEDLHQTLAASDFLKQGFERLWTPTYSLAIDLLSRRGDARAALETAELGRSRALLDLLASRQLGAPPGAASLPLTLRGAAETLASTAVAPSATTDDLVAAAARLHSTMLVFWVGDDKIFAWAIAPDGHIGSAVTPVVRRTLDALIRSTSAFTAAAPGGAAATTRGAQAIPLVMKPRPAWGELYDILIQPVAKYLPAAAGARLTVIPHGPLINVPFAALRDHRGRYLLERYAIHAVPAGAMLAYTASHHHPNARSGRALLVADPAHPPAPLGEPALPRLPGAAAEVRAVAALLSPARTTVLSGDAATEPRVLAAVGHRALLHFATHGIISDANPLSSFLALGRPADGSATGRLTAEQIYGLNLDADLVVLSACRSGAGSTSGDGIAALARAFFYAGASSLVVSLWDVADEPTNRLLPAFYGAWLHGAGKAEALRSAQLKLLADLRAGRVVVHTRIGDVVLPEDPAFWAGFVLLGEAD